MFQNVIFYSYHSPLAQFEIIFANYSWEQTIISVLLEPTLQNYSTDSIISVNFISVFLSSVFYSFISTAVFCFFFLFIASFQNQLFPKSNEEKSKFFIFKVSNNFIVSNNDFSLQPYYLFYFEFICSIFYYNISGLTPVSFTITAQLYSAFTLAFIAFIGINITGIIRRRYKFLNNFLPEGTLFELVWLVVFLELVSYMSRLFSISIRLFANIIAGHALIKIFASFTVSAVATGGVLLIPSFIGVSGLVLIFILEVAVAILQLYVFIVLLFFYIAEGIKGNHLF